MPSLMPIVASSVDVAYHRLQLATTSAPVIYQFPVTTMTTATSIFVSDDFGRNARSSFPLSSSAAIMSDESDQQLLDIFKNRSSPAERPPGSGLNRTGSSSSGLGMQAELRIALYVTIFVLSVAGNALVALTIIQNRRMRTLTNVLLMNLSVADLLLALFCMPFTLIPTLLRDFIFGPVVCVLVRYMQGVSVGVSSFTLVAISLERYFAICRPLRSRRWQTVSHSYKMISAVWTASVILMLPIAIYQRIKTLHGVELTIRKCVEVWDSPIAEQFYTAFLDVVLLVLPLVVMSTAYGLISYKLWPRGGVSGSRRPLTSPPPAAAVNGNSREIKCANAAVTGSGVDAIAPVDGNADDIITTAATGSGRHANAVGRHSLGALQFNLAQRSTAVDGSGSSSQQHPLQHHHLGQYRSRTSAPVTCRSGEASDGSIPLDVAVVRTIRRPSAPAKSTVGVDNVSAAAAARQLAALRLSGGVERCVAAKRRVVKMLFVVVIEFFVCWTPMYVLQTWVVFDSRSAQAKISAFAMNLVHLLGFASACCHPITYGFMNASFRRAFAAVFCVRSASNRRRRAALGGGGGGGGVGGIDQRQRRRNDSDAGVGGTSVGWPLGMTVDDEDSSCMQQPAGTTWGNGVGRRRLSSVGEQSLVVLQSTASASGRRYGPPSAASAEL